MISRKQPFLERPDPGVTDEDWIRESVRVTTLETRDCLAVCRHLEARGVRVVVTLLRNRSRIQGIHLEYGSVAAQPSRGFGLAPRDLYYDPELHGDEVWARTREGRAAATGRPRSVHRQDGKAGGAQRPTDRQKVLRTILRGLSEAKDLVGFVERVEEEGVTVTCSCRPYTTDIQGFLFELATAQVRGSDALVTKRMLGELGLAYDPSRHADELLKRVAASKCCRGRMKAPSGPRELAIGALGDRGSR